MTVSFDEQELLDALYTYLYYRCFTERAAGGLYKVNPHLVRSLDLMDVHPAIFGDCDRVVLFKDGDSEHTKPHGCEINYTLVCRAMVKVFGELGEPITGRVPKTSYPGVVEVTQVLQQCFHPDNIIFDASNAISLTNVQMDTCTWRGMAASEAIQLDDGYYIQAKDMEVTFQLRALT